MPRPKRPRSIHAPPSVVKFKPSGTGQTGEVTLTFEEFEAIRLCDFEGLDQAQAAVQMGISRQTFGRILKSARFTLSKVLVKGFQLKVTGGCYHVRGHENTHGQIKGGGRKRWRQSAINSMEKQIGPTGGTEMMDNDKTSQQQGSISNSNEKPGANQDQGRGQGQGQSKGSGTGCGKRGGRGRRNSGGKGDGS